MRNPERVHPHLSERNLLPKQIEALHQRGIRCPIYVTVQWDQFSAEQHPEWLCRTADGAVVGQKPYEPGFYGRLCMNTGYRDFLAAHTREIMETMPLDGFFFDIVTPIDCSCAKCRADMKVQGIDASDPQARIAFARDMLFDWKREMSALVRSVNPQATIFYNAGHIGPSLRPVHDTYSHYELESLPSGGWGYLHFPIAMHYARTLGHDCLSHTGKFHTSWGDFHSFKNQAALEFECFRMLALNAKCLIGDQMEPNGVLSQPVYDLIGRVYAQVERKEPWCVDAKPCVDIGLLTPEEYTGGSSAYLPPAVMGAVSLLDQGGYQYDILDSMSDLSPYRLLILPDEMVVSDALAARIEDFVQDGGSLIASCRSGLNLEKTAFALSVLGVELIGDAPYNHDFLLPKGEIGKGLPETEHVMYLPGLEVKALSGAQVLMDTVVPFFNRTWEHFSSHRHTPSSGKIGYPGVVHNGRCVYFMHPIFTQYRENAPRWCKQLLFNAIDLLLPDPLVRHDGPSTVLAALNEQKVQNRLVLHLLHYIPERRSETIDVIEDVIPLYELGVKVREDRPVTAVRLAPEGAELTFTQEDGYVRFTLPKLMGHQMVEIGY